MKTPLYARVLRRLGFVDRLELVHPTRDGAIYDRCWSRPFGPRLFAVRERDVEK